MSINVPELLDVDYSAVSRVKAGGNRRYISIHSLDLKLWGIETGDLVVVKITKLLKYTPLKENPMMEESR